MQDYSHTMELVDAANNSAGASQRQYEKTLDSLASKLAKLKNAWHEFTMGIAKSDFVKNLVDLATKLLNVINKLAGNSGLTKLLSGFLIFKTGKSVVKGSGGLISSLLGNPKNDAENYVNKFKTFLGKSLKLNAWTKEIEGISELFETSGFDEATRQAYALAYGYQLSRDNLTAYTNEQISGIRPVLQAIGEHKKLKLEFAREATVVGNTTTSLFGLNGAMKEGIGIIAGYTVIAAVAVAAIAGIAVAIHRASDESQLEGLQDNIEKTKDAAEEAKNNFNELNSTLDDLSTKTKDITELQKGTLEWKNAVHELNNEVLDLVEKNPELAQFVNTSGDYLTFDRTSEFENALKESKNKSYNLENAALAQQIEESKLRLDVTLEKLSEEYSSEDNGFNSFIMRHLAEGIENGSGIKEFEDKLKELGHNIDDLDIKGLYSDLREYNNAVIQSENEQKTYSAALRSNVLAVASSTNDYDKSINANNYNFLNNILSGSNLESIIENLIDETERDLKEKYAKAKYGSNAKLAGLGNNKIKVNGEVVEEGLNLKTKSALAQFIAGYQFNDNISTKLANLPSDIAKLPEEVKNVLVAENGALTRDQISETEADFNEIFNGLSSEMQEFFGSSENFEGIYDSIINAAEAEFTSGDSIFAQFLNGQNNELTYDSKTYSALAEKLNQVFMATGSSNAEALFNEIMQRANGANGKEFLSLVLGANWKSRSGLEALAQQLDDAGFAVKGLTDDIAEFAKATDEIKFEDFQEEIKTIDDLAAKVANSENGVFDTDTRNALVELGIDSENFVFTDEGSYTYLGNIQELLTEVRNKVLSKEGYSIDDYRRMVDENESMYNPELFKKYAEAIIGGDESKLASARLNGAYTAEWLGISLQDIINASDETLKAMFEQRLTQLNSNDIYKEQITQFERDQAQRSAAFTGSGQDLINIGTYEADKVLDAKIQTEGLTEAVEELKKRVNEAGIPISKERKEIKALALDGYNTTKKLNELNASLKENYEILNEGISSNEKGVEYYKALGDVTKDLSKYIGMDISSEFVETILPKLFEGGETAEKAIKELGKNTAQEYIYSLGKNLNLNSLSDKFENIDIKIKSTGVADFSSIYGEFSKAEIMASDFAKIMSALGYEVAYETGYMDTLGNLFKDIDPGIAKSEGLVPVKIVTGIKKAGGKSSIPNLNGKGSGSSKKSWENPYNPLYNIVEDLNDELRERNKIEKEYQLLVSRTADSILDERTYYEGTLDNLNEQLRLQKLLFKNDQRNYLAQAQVKMKDIPTEYSGMVSLNGNKLRIDWDKIDSLKADTETLTEAEYDKRQKLVDTISAVKELIGLANDAEDGIIEIEQSIEDFKQSYIDRSISFIQRVTSAIESVRQQEIDAQKEVNDSIDSAASDLTGAIRKNIDKLRQDRENENTEEEIAKKERRLAYLRMDTSGSHNAEIAKLQQELDDAKQDYQDNLIDQSIEAMEEQNDAASQQRERQIAMMESQLEYDKRTGKLAEQAVDIIEESASRGYVDENSPLYQMLFKGEGWMSTSSSELFEKLQELNTSLVVMSIAMEKQLLYSEKTDYSQLIDNAVNEYKVAMEEGNAQLAAALLQEITMLNIMRNDKIRDTDSDYEEIDTDELYKQVVSGEYSSGIFGKKKGGISGGQSNGSYSNGSNSDNNESPEPPKITRTGIDIGISGVTVQPNKGYGNYSGAPKDKKSIEAIQKGLNAAVDAGLEIDGMFGPETAKATKAFQSMTGLTADGIVGTDTLPVLIDYLKNMSPVYYYKSGGLADFTGPAWLDGTKAKPEVVLNAADSQNFIQLRNLLRNADLQNSGNIVGDSYFDIDINVDEINDDYDVDSLAARIKEIIYRDATYRQVNALGLYR